jgi:hypothetical protein
VTIHGFFGTDRFACLRQNTLKCTDLNLMTHLTPDFSDLLWSGFRATLMQVVDRHAHKCSKTLYIYSSKRKYPYPAGIRRAIKRKRCIWRKIEEMPHDEALKLSYHKAEARCRALIRGYELNEEQRVVESSNIGSFHRFVNKRYNLNVISGLWYSYALFLCLK